MRNLFIAVLLLLMSISVDAQILTIKELEKITAAILEDDEDKLSKVSLEMREATPVLFDDVAKLAVLKWNKLGLFEVLGSANVP